MQLTDEQRAFIVKRYFESKSFVTVQESFQQIYPGRIPPSKSTIQRNVAKYTREGTSHNLNKGRSGSLRTARNQENVNRVRRLLEEQPRGISCRRNPLNLTKSTFNRITRHDLKWHPYKICIVQELSQNDMQRRIQFCQWFTQRAQNVRFMYNIIIGDEAAFHMNGTVSTQNVRCYSPQGHPPQDFKYEKSNDRHKLHVWVGLCGNGRIVGPHFFDRNVNGGIYGEMLQNVVFPVVAHNYQSYGPVFDGLWWFQDGAPPHRSLAVRRLLRTRFENRVVALHHPVEWPPRSPDLTPLDFFLWGYLKERVFSRPPPDLATLRRRIVDEVNHLQRDERIIRRAFGAMRAKADRCIQKGGSHIECH